MTDQHTEIEIGAEESKRGKEVRCGGLEAGGGVGQRKTADIEFKGVQSGL